MRFLTLLMMISFHGVSFAGTSRPTIRCDGIWEVDEALPFIEGCPIVITAHPKDGPIEVRHLSRATVDKCAYEDIISNSGPTNQIVCRFLNK